MATSSLFCWARNAPAPAPASLASTCVMNYVGEVRKIQYGYVSSCFTLAKASSCSAFQCSEIRLAFFFFVGVTSGAITVAKFGMNFLTKIIVPSTDRNFLMFVGRGKSTIALIRSSPILIPSADKIWPS